MDRLEGHEPASHFGSAKLPSVVGKVGEDVSVVNVKVSSEPVGERDIDAGHSGAFFLSRGFDVDDSTILLAHIVVGREERRQTHGGDPLEVVYAVPEENLIEAPGARFERDNETVEALRCCVEESSEVFEAIGEAGEVSEESLPGGDLRFGELEDKVDGRTKMDWNRGGCRQSEDRRESSSAGDEFPEALRRQDFAIARTVDEQQNLLVSSDRFGDNPLDESGVEWT
mmetsp:Transcript_4929/g.16163  ORF Transcript_4929/g.16163 Transcript_4929/m.16163 type:complete len:227 (-) Transcript_4929:248-928(-)